MDTNKTREEEATSSETLEDLEESNVDTDANESDGPSPDGALDQTEELHNADPM